MIVVHGGAGDMEAERETESRAGAEAAVRAGLAILEGGGSALDAVQCAVRVLEDDPSFNAGTGSVLTRERTIENDAAIMEGTRRTLGAVAAMPFCNRAIDAARAVMDHGQHVLLCGQGAWELASAAGIEPSTLEAMICERSDRRWRAARDKTLVGNDQGTVGACAIDARGGSAAATSTGGTTFKRPGRIGDTPLCGSGTYADDRGGAASATGIGEGIIRVTMTRVCVDAMRHGATAQEAAWEAIDELGLIDCNAGIICVDRHGGVGVGLSEPTMPWAWGQVGGRLEVGVTVSR